MYTKAAYLAIMFSLELTSSQYVLRYLFVSYSQFSFAPVADISESHKSKCCDLNGDYFNKLCYTIVSWIRTPALRHTLSRATRFVCDLRVLPQWCMGTEEQCFSPCMCSKSRRALQIVLFGSHPLYLSDWWLVTQLWFNLSVNGWLICS